MSLSALNSLPRRVSLCTPPRAVAPGGSVNKARGQYGWRPYEASVGSRCQWIGSGAVDARWWNAGRARARPQWSARRAACDQMMILMSAAGRASVPLVRCSRSRPAGPEALSGPCSAAFDLPHALGEWETLLVAPARELAAASSLVQVSPRAPAYLRKHVALHRARRWLRHIRGHHPRICHDAEPGTRQDPRCCRTRRRLPEALANSPPVPPRPEPHGGHRRHGPRPGEATPKRLNGPIAATSSLTRTRCRLVHAGGDYQILIFVILWMGSPGTLPKCHLSTVPLVAGAPSLGTYSKVTLLSPVQIRSTP